MEVAIIVVALVALLAVVVLLRVIRQRDEVTGQRDEASRQRDQATRELASLKAAEAARLAEIEKARRDLDTYFKGMAADVLRANSQAFLEQAREQFAGQAKLSDSDLEKRQQAIDALVKPVQDSLGRSSGSGSTTSSRSGRAPMRD